MKWLVTETLAHDGKPEMIAGEYPWAKIESLEGRQIITVPEDGKKRVAMTRQEFRIHLDTANAMGGEFNMKMALDGIFGEEG